MKHKKHNSFSFMTVFDDVSLIFSKLNTPLSKYRHKEWLKTEDEDRVIIIIYAAAYAKKLNNNIAVWKHYVAEMA